MKRKYDQSLTPEDLTNIFRPLPDEIAGVIARHSSAKDILNLMSTSITTHNLFKPNLPPLFAMRAQTCVVQGDPDGLALIAKHNPDALFEKCRVIDLNGCIFYSISAYQLYTFLCDEDMHKKIKPLIPERLNENRQNQYAELGVGGADLIKLSFDPLKAAKKNFKTITEFKPRYIFHDGTRKDIKFLLFENKDAIIYYQDAKGEVNFYYANRETKEISQLSEWAYAEEDQQKLKQFKASFVDMEDNSSRRSSDAEHLLIETILKCKLHRDGIQYEQNGISYRDSHTSFPVINAYRKCIRLYLEAEGNGQSEIAHQYWRKGVGHAQRAVMWVLQRLCEESPPFHPLPDNFDNFKRGVTIHNWVLGKEENLLIAGKLVDSLGTAYAIYKAGACPPLHVHMRAVGSCPSTGFIFDLIAICCLVESAKAKVIELQEEDLPTQVASPGQ